MKSEEPKDDAEGAVSFHNYLFEPRFRFRTRQNAAERRAARRRLRCFAGDDVTGADDDRRALPDEWMP